MDTAEHDRAVSMAMLICKYLSEFLVLCESILGRESAGKFGKKIGRKSRETIPLKSAMNKCFAFHQL